MIRTMELFKMNNNSISLNLLWKTKTCSGYTTLLVRYKKLRNYKEYHSKCKLEYS